MKTNKKETKMVKLNNVLGKVQKITLAAFCTLLIIAAFSTPVYASGIIDTVIDNMVEFLAWGVGIIGGMIAIFGLITLGLAFSADNAAEKQKAIMMIVGGIIVVAVGVLIGTVGPQILTPPSF